MVTALGSRSPSMAVPMPISTVTELSSAVPPPEKQKHERASSDPALLEYVSPVKKLKKYVIDNIEGTLAAANCQSGADVVACMSWLRAFIASNDMTDPQIRGSVRIQARLLWAAEDDTHRAHFLCVYLGDQRAPEPLADQQKVPLRYIVDPLKH
ncbi:hypothetical protein PHYSODRAFT_249585 [Phytophthora sojae]|uniref:Uncharacterized protein n=1 Tax=Phytophthora sojae (strain P6497) TaxID=1094619 RepID=G4Z6F0_PHYSP|nr:hypothetical protein PHYSODRAFT_249585 [Phytophthora sojae]EGZ22398.1 hypothetical protein PHYSODRAFT_249585 [Phytophthora sojae]|eukprot:XP_009525115.1 hypothetical protein PHYSODRAFT_249585 [Phytophthora sojae]